MVGTDIVLGSARLAVVRLRPRRGSDSPRRRLPQRSMTRLGPCDRVRDLVQNGVLDLLLAALQDMAAADPDHAVTEIAVAEAAPGFDEGEGPAGEPMLVHQPPGHPRDVVQPLRAVPRTLPFGDAEQAIGDVPACLPAAARPLSSG